ncbi:sulfatase family protein [Cerasicoccus arenae]|uniref:Heparan N-sulfatase n=1 Tax=Cerasicoccus arenae TaxID=424488 RepID=A0A8J3DFE1_9BACT|nr:sulfatase [Cerasicoccus arenae]MBK1857121.1 sulfatase [Cerasicoccus arenae]GHB92490.1 heparan N-sulfatase [Cerasicoccus arenae]
MKPLNIVYLHAHDAGTYIQPYGYAVETPHMQQFAEQGMLFRKAFSVNPTCSPSRACLLTGQAAHNNGMLGLAHRGGRLNNYEDTLIHFLKGHGLHTALSGIQHIAHEPYAPVEIIGYDEILDQAVADDAGGTRRRYVEGSEGVTAAAEDFLARNHDKPFFLDVGYFPPHRIGEGDFPSDFDVPNPAYVRPPAHLPDTEETRQDFANYMASVKTFDSYAGRVLEAIDRNGLAENTLVIATTDHGIAFPGMKCRLTDHGLNVMLMLRGPGGFEGGKITDEMVSHLDIFPTICDVLGLPMPDRLEGQSLKVLAENPHDSLHDCVFAEVNVHAAYEPMRAVRTKRWKYIRHLHPMDHVILPNVDNGLSKGYLCDHDWASRPPATEELYDLLFDPTEACNLASQTECAAVLDELRAKLDTWMLETDDPLLKGQLDLPDWVVTPAEAYSPSGGPRPVS